MGDNAEITYPGGRTNMADTHNDGAQRIFISEVQGHQARYRKLLQFTHSSTKAAR